MQRFATLLEGNEATYHQLMRTVISQMGARQGYIGVLERDGVPPEQIESLIAYQRNTMSYQAQILQGIDDTSEGYRSAIATFTGECSGPREEARFWFLPKSIASKYYCVNNAATRTLYAPPKTQH